MCDFTPLHLRTVKKKVYSKHKLLAVTCENQMFTVKVFELDLEEEDEP